MYNMKLLLNALKQTDKDLRHFSRTLIYFFLGLMNMELLFKILGRFNHEKRHESQTHIDVTLLCMAITVLYMVFTAVYFFMGYEHLYIFMSVQSATMLVLYFVCRANIKSGDQIAYIGLVVSILSLHFMLNRYLGECGSWFTIVAVIAPNHLFSILKLRHQLLVDVFLIVCVNLTFILNLNIHPIYECTPALGLIILNSGLVICVFEFYVLLISRKATDHMQLEIIEKTAQAACCDELTKIGNRRLFSQLRSEIEKMDDLCVAMMDIDHFKKINDNYGHAAGDKVLVYIAEVMKTVFRRDDILIRWGGEEFVVFFRGMDISQSVHSLERFRRHLRENPIVLDGRIINIELTIGLQQHDHAVSIAETIEKADKQMYIGKIQGRNRIILGDLIAGI